MQFNDSYRLHIIPDGKELGFAISEETPADTIKTVVVRESLLAQLTMLHREDVQMILRCLVDDNLNK